MDDKTKLSRDFAIQLSELAIKFAIENKDFDQNVMLNGISMFLCVTIHEMQQNQKENVLSKVIENIIHNYELFNESRQSD